VSLLVVNELFEDKCGAFIGLCGQTQTIINFDITDSNIIPDIENAI